MTSWRALRISSKLAVSLYHWCHCCDHWCREELTGALQLLITGAEQSSLVPSGDHCCRAKLIGATAVITGAELNLLMPLLWSLVPSWAYWCHCCRTEVTSARLWSLVLLKSAGTSLTARSSRPILSELTPSGAGPVQGPTSVRSCSVKKNKKWDRSKHKTQLHSKTTCKKAGLKIWKQDLVILFVSLYFF